MTLLSDFLAAVKAPQFHTDYDSVKHFHKCPNCGNVWGHSRKEVRAMDLGGRELAHKCGKCGEGEDYYARNKPGTDKVGKSMADRPRPKPKKAGPKSKFLTQLETL